MLRLVCQHGTRTMNLCPETYQKPTCRLEELALDIKDVARRERRLKIVGFRYGPTVIR